MPVGQRCSHCAGQDCDHGGRLSTQVALAGRAGGNAATNNYLSHSPFPKVRALAAAENARLTAECESNCTREQFGSNDAQVAALERAANLVELARRDGISPDQAKQLAQTLLELAPVYGTGESVLQLVTGQSSLTGEDASRIWAAVGLVPLAGGIVRKVGEPVVESLASALRATLDSTALSKVEVEAEALRNIAERNATLSAKLDNAIMNRADAQLYNDLAARAKIRPDTSMDAFYAAQTDLTVLANNNSTWRTC